MTCINRFRALLVSSSLTLLSSCAGYQVTLNDRTIYEPPPLFQDFTIPDDGLRQCIAQHISDQNITKAEQLQRVVCSYTDIISLQGIEVFTEIRQLNVAHNKITNLASIAGLSALEQFSAKDNRLTDVSALAGLEHLHHLDLSDNPTLSCDHLELVLKNTPASATLLMPAQCVE